MPACGETLRRAGLDTVDRALKHLGDRVVAWSRSTDTIRVSLPDAEGGGAVFVKRYHFLRWRKRIKAALRGSFFGRSRAHAEFERLQEMRAAGASVVRPLAYGERRILHFVRSSVLITEGVDGAVCLTTFAREIADGQRTPLTFRQRRQFVETLGQCVGDLHRKGLVHGALFWRNILVRSKGNGHEFLLLDAPGRWHLDLRRHAERHAVAVRGDLAALAALAPRFCTRSEMLRFFFAYLGTRTLDAEHRRLAHDVAARAEPLRDHELYRLKMNRVFHHHLAAHGG